MAIVLPDAILGAPGVDYASVREWIIQHCKIISSIGLHLDTFQPHNGTQTSVLFLQKKTQQEMDEEARTRTMKNYNVFFAMVDKIGHDKRGNTIFKRDNGGNELLVPETDSLLMSNISDGTLTIQNMPKRKSLTTKQMRLPINFLGGRSQRESNGKSKSDPTKCFTKA